MKFEKSIFHPGSTYYLAESYSEVETNTDLPKLKKACVTFVGGEISDGTVTETEVETDSEQKVVVFKGTQGTAQLTVWEDESRRAEILAFGYGEKRSLGLQEGL